MPLPVYVACNTNTNTQTPTPTPTNRMANQPPYPHARLAQEKHLQATIGYFPERVAPPVMITVQSRNKRTPTRSFVPTVATQQSDRA